MRRLLSLLRDSQGYCTDSECISDAPGPQGAGILAGGNNLMMIAVLWGIIALLMYFMRPNSMRSRPAEPPNKPGPSNGPDGHEPPAPEVN